MTPLRRLTPLLLIALIPLGACGRPGPGQAAASRATVPNVGIAPERPAALAAAPAVPAAPAVTTTSPQRTTTTTTTTTDPGGVGADTTDAGTTEPDGSVAIGPGGIETDPARRKWLEFTENADPDSFAGGATLADIVGGNRVLMIGDSVMASTSARYGGEMCDSVITGGWDVEVDAETGRFIDFGDKVLDQRLDADFDVVVILLGNNYDANPDVYEEYLRDLVERIDDRPVILSTVTVFQPNRMEVNNIIYDIAQDFVNIRVLDWAGETETNAALTGGDGLHLSDAGRGRLADMVAAELGDAPSGAGEGDCLGSSFTDDSAGQDNTGPLEGQVTVPPNGPSNTSQNTTRPTVPGTGPAESSIPQSTTPGGGTGGGGTTVGPTVPPTQATTPVTQPPGPTNPPPTNPPAVTAPPTAPAAPEGGG